MFYQNRPFHPPYNNQNAFYQSPAGLSRPTMESSTSSQVNQPYSPVNHNNLDIDFEQLMFSQDYYQSQDYSMGHSSAHGSAHGSAPVNADEEDDYLVEEVSPVKPKKPSRRAAMAKKNDPKEPPKEWTVEEEIALCQAWCDVSENNVVRNSMKTKGFWDAVITYIEKETGSSRGYDTILTNERIGFALVLVLFAPSSIMLKRIKKVVQMTSMCTKSVCIIQNDLQARIYIGALLYHFERSPSKMQPVRQSQRFSKSTQAKNLVCNIESPSTGNQIDKNNKNKRTRSLPSDMPIEETKKSKLVYAPDMPVEEPKKSKLAYAPDFDVVDEATAKMKLEITSKPIASDEIDHPVLQLQMEGFGRAYALR
nr:hypothetical protein [Tanacetum cinerariifolium]